MRRVSTPGRRSRWIFGAAIISILFALIVGSSSLGLVRVPLGTTIEILLHQTFGGSLVPDPCAHAAPPGTACATQVFVVWDIYLPEVLLALLVGAALGVSGAALQGVFRNPLADPFLLGISSGGTLGAAILYVYRVQTANAELFLPLFAFIGATATGLLILTVARGRGSSTETVLLAGVALANLLSAILSLVLLYNPVGSLQVTFWLLGGLSQATWTIDAVAFAGTLLFGSALLLFGRELNLLQLGSDVAQSAGVDVRTVRFIVLLLASLTTAVAVAFTGVIGFVGLVSPHIVRRFAGTSYRRVLPGSAAVGAIFLLSARDVGNLASPGSLFPLGIFTAFAGVPFFLFLLYRQRKRTTMG